MMKVQLPGLHNFTMYAYYKLLRRKISYLKKMIGDCKLFQWENFVFFGGLIDRKKAVIPIAQAI